MYMYVLCTYPTSQKRMAPSEPPLANIFSCTGCHASTVGRREGRGGEGRGGEGRKGREEGSVTFM